ncbi:FkbM family methyltransferase [Azospirillum lipoferum]|uniref:Methyltransferase FkbM domain-containing protein n=1 Tax=Azospirillum lipoferum TaxID=193 RepID=A0A5A9GLB2_AZOLI|nr:MULTISPECIES: FkbM family methyltransferase [Azospirillum]KAA0594444.1 hypothetical protein FZ942_20485 [Azospirillum lipoferum]MCP1613190.1 FkbM family methyltransferase [Azospirillum lipoferum]MDW5531389.1 FkbM family methyltransferase [Azospirillum sp. NL1]
MSACEAVPGVTGDDLPRRAGETTADLVKINVEGAEVQALGGMADLLEQRGPDLLIACFDEESAAKVDAIVKG